MSSTKSSSKGVELTDEQKKLMIGFALFVTQQGFEWNIRGYWWKPDEPEATFTNDGLLEFYLIIREKGYAQ
jgi:hypothetical protein